MEIVKLSQLSNSNSYFLKLKFSGYLRRVNETHVEKIHLDSKLQFLPVSRLIPSYLMPLFQMESSCKTFLTKISLICLKRTFIIMVAQEDSFWPRGKGQAGNGLFQEVWLERLVSLYNVSLFAYYCRLRHERLKKVPRDMGGPNAYQTLTCFELEDTPPLPNPPSSSSIDDPFDIRI